MAFQQIKYLLSQTPTLAYYEPNMRVSVSEDASSKGLGSCLMQEKYGQRELVGYTSCTLSDTEKWYLQIEKESLALTWCTDRFHQYILGLEVTLETDHKPIIQNLQTKHIDYLTPRLQRFCLQLMRYTYSVQCVPGKQLDVVDCLSQSPLEERIQEDKHSIQSLAQTYDFQVVTSSSHYSQSNGCVEVAVKVTKSLLKKNEDISMGLLSYRTTPLGSGFSPVEMLMDRRLRSILPLLPSVLEEVVRPWLAQNIEHLQNENKCLIITEDTEFVIYWTYR
ncbi:hypothetical protein PR048_000953 [Dryococelus australis]|uniref:Reverse transcriptase RNase H-like domain-containing protein n=1 Tax=Dryococelus australis TaxID=614101 RepID=A0ABQ9IG29_9NEOP|nr:hypothetical protein PR048_000953 [Dryococelus australis]